LKFLRYSTYNRVIGLRHTVKNVKQILVDAFEFTGAARVFKSKFFCGLAAVSKRLNNTALKYMYVGPIP